MKFAATYLIAVALAVCLVACASLKPICALNGLFTGSPSGAFVSP